MTVLGIIAGVMTTTSFMPQVVRSYRIGSAHHFSWAWLCLFAGGVAAWVAYGVVRDDAAIICANAVTLLLVLSLIGLRIQEALRLERSRRAS